MREQVDRFVRCRRRPDELQVVLLGDGRTQCLAVVGSGVIVSVDGFRIYAEVALLRDAYYTRRAESPPLMDDLVNVVMTQEGVSECRVYSELAIELQSPWLTHPRQIRFKAGDELSPGESKVDGAVQGMFNAKA